ncbi:uncharacterized protein LOC144578080 [Callithrix jacchus]
MYNGRDACNVSVTSERLPVRFYNNHIVRSLQKPYEDSSWWSNLESADLHVLVPWKPLHSLCYCQSYQMEMTENGTILCEYSLIQHKTEIMSFAGTWMELEVGPLPRRREASCQGHQEQRTHVMKADPFSCVWVAVPTLACRSSRNRHTVFHNG